MISADWLVIYSLVLMVSRKCELDCHRFLFRWVWDRCNETQTDTQRERCDRCSKKKRRRPDHAAVDDCCRQGAASPSNTSTITVIIYIRSVEPGSQMHHKHLMTRITPTFAGQSELLYGDGIECASLVHRSARRNPSNRINQPAGPHTGGLGRQKKKRKRNCTLMVCGLADVRVDVYACHWRLRVHSTETKSAN